MKPIKVGQDQKGDCIRNRKFNLNVIVAGTRATTTLKQQKLKDRTRKELMDRRKALLVFYKNE